MSADENITEGANNMDEQPSQDSSEVITDDEYIEQLQAQIENLEAKAAENWDLAVRAKAEMENIKRRASRDVENARKYALEKFATDLLPVVDSLEQGLISTEQATDVNSIREGLDMTVKMLIKTLETQGLIQVHPQGEKFNPEVHEAMSMIEHPEVAADHVIDVFQKGYQLNGRVVRPARVVVSRGTTEPPSIDEKV